MRLCDLRQKDVINTCTCKSLGCPADLEFDCKTGCITAIIVPGPARLCNLLARDNEFVIPWACVQQIGEDIILVEINEEKCTKKC
ncbi:MAG: YlmC/YmxH family sporulation protein [Lachnospiraceae bacterium]|nr:YlmC/YmxH family sporulation protein [Lachnospiraceae bacterium]